MEHIVFSLKKQRKHKENQGFCISRITKPKENMVFYYRPEYKKYKKYKKYKSDDSRFLSLELLWNLKHDWIVEYQYRGPRSTVRNADCDNETHPKKQGVVYARGKRQHQDM